jgi:hypothetical protein
MRALGNLVSFPPGEQPHDAPSRPTLAPSSGFLAAKTCAPKKSSRPSKIDHITLLRRPDPAENPPVNYFMGCFWTVNQVPYWARNATIAQPILHHFLTFAP